MKKLILGLFLVGVLISAYIFFPRYTIKTVRSEIIKYDKITGKSFLLVDGSYWDEIKDSYEEYEKDMNEVPARTYKTAELMAIENKGD